MFLEASPVLVSVVYRLDVLSTHNSLPAYPASSHLAMLFDSSNPIHSFHLITQNNDIRRALHHVTMLSCLLFVPPQNRGMSATLTKENTSTPLLHNSPLQQTTPRILRKKRGIRDLRAAFRKFQLPTGSSRSSFTDTNRSSTPTLSTDPASLLSFPQVYDSTDSILLCIHGRESVADFNDRPKTDDASQHMPVPTRVHRKAALDNLRGAFKHYDHSSGKVTGSPFVGAAPATSNEYFDAVVTLSPDCGPVYISLPLPPPLRHEEVVADIPFVARPLRRGIPVYARTHTHTDFSIPPIWRGRSTRHH